MENEDDRLLTPKKVLKIAGLARIRIEPHEIEPLQKDLNRVLEWIALLDEVNVDGVEPFTSTDISMSLKTREDLVTEPDNREKLLKNAPEATEDFFTVPKVLE